MARLSGIPTNHWLSPVVVSAPTLGLPREPEKNYAKHDFNDVREGSVKTEIRGGWVAMVQHYFIGAWVPPADQINSLVCVSCLARISTCLVIPERDGGSSWCNGDTVHSSTLAPKIRKSLNPGRVPGFNRGLRFPVDVGQADFAAMKFIYELVGNWGWAIILLTVVIKILLTPCGQPAFHGKMRSLQPKMESLKEAYGDDRQKMSQELMALYKKGGQLCWRLLPYVAADACIPSPLLGAAGEC